MTDLERIPEGLEIPIDSDRRLLVQTWENAHGVRLVTVIPKFKDRGHEWRLAHSGLMLTPKAARELAPAIVAMAATIEDCIADPMPTAEDRELSRRP